MFELGAIFLTPNALEALSNDAYNSLELLARHQSLDSPELCEADQKANRDAIVQGGRILSRYTIEGVKLYIITESDRSATTVLRADEY